MAEFPNQNRGLGPVSLTPILQASIEMQPQVQIQQFIPPHQMQATEVKPRYKHRNTLYELGISEVVFGSISVILGIMTLIIAAENPGKYYDHTFSWTSPGIWCGLLLIATGILGIKAKGNPSVCMYNANMAMSIVTANVMIVLMALSGVAAIIELNYYFYDRNPLYSLVALHIILGIIGVATAIMCIVHSAHCCAGVCCRRHTSSHPHDVQQPQRLVKLSAEAEGNPAVSATRVSQQPTAAALEEVKPRYKYKALLYRFGVTEIIFGSVSMLLGIATLIIASQFTTYTYHPSWSDSLYTNDYYHGFTYTSPGIWTGAFLVVTGILGVMTKSNPTVRIYNANMATSIIAAALMLPLMVFSAYAAEENAVRYSPGHRIHSLIAFHSILVAIGIVALVVCIVHSAYCCAGVCCRRPKPHQGPVVYASQPHAIQQPQQMVQLTNGQFILVPVQHVAGPGYPGESASTSSNIMPVMHQTPQGGVVVPPMNV